MGFYEVIFTNSLKPRNLDELKQGIQQFWETLTPDVCQQYIEHLQKVIPKVIQVQGGPSDTSNN